MRMFAPALVLLFFHAPAMSQIMLPGDWHDGAEECGAADARFESHDLTDDTVVFRQNPCIDSEANFLYLLIGRDRAMLVDSGASEDATLAKLTVDGVSAALERRGVRLPLLVVHTHGHRDHRAGDPAFAQLADAEIVPAESEAMRRFFGFADWPDKPASLDLGDRIVDVIPAPGHHEDHVVFYDRRTGLLLTGDFLLPGRLLVDDLGEYRASAARVAAFARSQPVSHVLGAHAELDAKGEAYPTGATIHPDERGLALSVEDVLALPGALADFNGFYSRHRNFIVVDPVHNLLALATVVIVALALLVWGIRALRRRRRART